MRRLPVYIVIDVSESMVGQPIEQVRKGMREIVQQLRSDPYALETAWVSVIAFAGRPKTLTPLTETYCFFPPEVPIGGGTGLGAVLNHLMDDIEKNVVKTTAQRKGDWKPVVFLLTDGTPTDNPSAAIARWNGSFRRRASMTVISIGDTIDPLLFGQLTDSIVRFNADGEDSYKNFFRWISASVTASSQSVADFGEEGVKHAPMEGINLEKVKVEDRGESRTDENYAVFEGKCQHTGNRYLIKYARRPEGMRFGNDMSATDFKLVRAYPIDGEVYDSMSAKGQKQRTINVSRLYGEPICPCCGNQHGFVTCSCGRIFCVGEEETIRCPWCGMEGTLTVTNEGFDVGRTQG